MTDAAIDEVREAIREQRSEIREDLEEAGVDVGAWATTDEARDRPPHDDDTAESH